MKTSMPYGIGQRTTSLEITSRSRSKWKPLAAIRTL